MGREGIAARVKEAEHTQAGQEDLGRPGQQEGQQQPLVPEEGAAAQPGDRPGRAALGVGDERLFPAHFVPPLHSMRMHQTQAELRIKGAFRKYSAISAGLAPRFHSCSRFVQPGCVGSRVSGFHRNRNRRGERSHLCLPSRNNAMALSMRRWRVPALFAALMLSTW
jgi:hypothetical protein